jgi:hypothetical protein
MSLGYITLTDDRGFKELVNIRAILRYDNYKNPHLLNTKTRLWYLCGHFINIREDRNQIDKLINNILN